MWTHRLVQLNTAYILKTYFKLPIKSDENVMMHFGSLIQANANVHFLAIRRAFTNQASYSSHIEHYNTSHSFSESGSSIHSQ